MLKLSSDLNPNWDVQCKKRGYRMEKLNTLAFPKGKTPMCEITGQPSSVQLVTPYITLFFATREDALSSWEGIMYKLCPLLGPLRDEPEVIGSEEDRKRRKNVRHERQIDITSEESSKLLRENVPILAAALALSSHVKCVVFERKFESPFFVITRMSLKSLVSLLHNHKNITRTPTLLRLLRLIIASALEHSTERVACPCPRSCFASAYISMKKVSRAEFSHKGKMCALKNEADARTMSRQSFIVLVERADVANRAALKQFAHAYHRPFTRVRTRRDIERILRPCERFL